MPRTPTDEALDKEAMYVTLFLGLFVAAPLGILLAEYGPTSADIHCAMTAGVRSQEPDKYQELSEFCALSHEEQAEYRQLVNQPKPGVPSPFYTHKETLEALKRKSQ